MTVTTSPLPPPGAPLPHYVSREPFDPRSIEKLTPEQERVFLASQWRLMWWKFRRHRVAVWSGIFLAFMYGSILISEFLAPYNLHTRNIEFIHAPPQGLHLFHEGRFVGPFVYGLEYELNMTNLKREYTPDRSGSTRSASSAAAIPTGSGA
jgi:peptide/nickel transport system permease protein